ncbi:MAG: TldD protein [Cyclobacteriaceae bacterium]|jgi:TldD protein
MKKIRLITLQIILLAPFIANGQNDLQKTVGEELAREFTLLSQATPPVYYLSYKIDDLERTTIQATLGSLTALDRQPSRVLSIDLRVGDYALDNSDAGMNRYRQMIPLPISNNPDAIKQSLWLSTDLMYKFGSATYNKAKAEKKGEQNSFEKMAPSSFNDTNQSTKLTVDLEVWKKKVTELSALFNDVTDIVDASVRLSVVNNDIYFLSSEGASIAQNQRIFEIQMSANVRSADGEAINLNKNYFAPSLEKLPLQEILEVDISVMKSKLEELRLAPKAEPFSGPAIMSGSAASVFFHEIFGHRIESHRLGDAKDSQTFKDKLGEKVLPKFLSITFDPTIDQYDQYYLTGSYTYDDEGVKAQRVDVVENGVLKSFLNSRKPLDKESKSNGHARAQSGFGPVSRQSNLIVKSDKTKNDEALKKELIKECKRQGKVYGYFISQVAGGYTMTDRYRPNAFSIAPTEVYKVFVDGSPDQLVRGVDLIGTPLTMFSQILATGETLDAFYGYCGAESGYVPVTALSPALLVKKIETQKSIENNIEQPILADPNQLKN